MKSSNQIPWDYRTYIYYLIHFNTPKKKKLPEGSKPEEKLKQLFLVVLLSILASSCITRKACERRFPLTGYDSISVVTNTVTTYRDTTIYIHLPGDTVYRSIGVDEGVSELKLPMARSLAWVKDGRLEHRLERRDTVIQKGLPDAIKNITNLTQKERIVYRTKEINFLTFWDKVWIWLGRIAVFGIALILGILHFLRYVSRFGA